MNWKTCTQKDFWSRKADRKHVLQVFQDEQVKRASVTEFVKQGLEASAFVVLITDQQLADQLRLDLKIQASDPSTSDLLCIDLQSAASSYLKNGQPERQDLEQFILDLKQKAAGKTIRLYGELAGWLWAQGKTSEAQLLEEYWHELALLHGLTLFCAYPQHHLLNTQAPFHTIMKTHDLEVISGSGSNLLYLSQA